MSARAGITNLLVPSITIAFFENFSLEKSSIWAILLFFIRIDLLFSILSPVIAIRLIFLITISFLFCAKEKQTIQIKNKK